MHFFIMCKQKQQKFPTTTISINIFKRMFIEQDKWFKEKIISNLKWRNFNIIFEDLSFIQNLIQFQLINTKTNQVKSVEIKCEINSLTHNRNRYGKYCDLRVVIHCILLDDFDFSLFVIYITIEHWVFVKPKQKIINGFILSDEFFWN
jgi:hypothetical protein